MRKTLLIVGLFIVLAGCMSQKAIMNSYVGKDTSLLYKKWGTPADVSENANGLVIIYEDYVPTGEPEWPDMDNGVSPRTFIRVERTFYAS